MPTYEELASLYSEDYSDQDGEDFRFLAFVTYGGTKHVEPIGDNLTKQAHDIYKKYGKQTQISVYK